MKKQRSQSFCAESQLYDWKRPITTGKGGLSASSTRGGSFVKGAPQDEYFHWSSQENVLCIYVEYCVTSRAGKCLETCNTDKPRFDDFTGRPVRVRAAGFTGSISSLCLSEIPLAKPIPRSKFSEERNSTDSRISLWKSTTFVAIDHFTSTTCFWTTSLEIQWCQDVQLLFRWKLHFQCDLR